MLTPTWNVFLLPKHLKKSNKGAYVSSISLNKLALLVISDIHIAVILLMKKHRFSFIKNEKKECIIALSWSMEITFLYEVWFLIYYNILNIENKFILTKNQLHHQHLSKGQMFDIEWSTCM